MIRALRLKFVAICMALVTAVLAVVLGSLYLSLRQNVEAISQDLLQRAIQDAGLLESLFSRPGGPAVEGQALLPYFTVEIIGDTAYVTGGTYSDLENTEALQSILTDCLAQPEAEGTLKDYSLRYLRQDGFYQKIAFVDMSMEQAMLGEMMRSYVLIALVALLLLLGVSVVLSRWAVKPVERAWKQQRQFLSDASHELKTPLTVILSNAELLSSSQLEERPARWADNIHSEAGQMKTLVEEMLTLARADATSAPPERAPLSLTEVATDCALSFEPVAFEAGKTLHYQLAEGITLSGDRDRLRRLISILLDNAVKYSGDGAAITMTLEGSDRQAVLTVSNPGDPIPPEHLPRLFQRFYRADPSRGEKTGFGLGLSIADTIVREHGGTIRAESDAVSTRFTVVLPLKK